MDKPLLDRVRSFCLGLPATEESARLGGEPHFYVNGKIFAGCGIEDGRWCVGMKVGLDLQPILVSRPGFRIAKYVGKHGWITVEEQALADDAELRQLLQRSYELIAAGKGRRKVGGGVARTAALQPAAKAKGAPRAKVKKVAEAKPLKKVATPSARSAKGPAGAGKKPRRRR